MYNTTGEHLIQQLCIQAIQASQAPSYIQLALCCFQHACFSSQLTLQNLDELLAMRPVPQIHCCTSHQHHCTRLQQNDCLNTHSLASSRLGELVSCNMKSLLKGGQLTWKLLKQDYQYSQSGCDSSCDCCFLLFWCMQMFPCLFSELVAWEKLQCSCSKQLK